MIIPQIQQQQKEIIRHDKKQKKKKLSHDKEKTQSIKIKPVSIETY